MSSFKNIMNSLLQSSSEGIRRPLWIISEAALGLNYQYVIFEKLCPEFVHWFLSVYYKNKFQIYIHFSFLKM